MNWEERLIEYKDTERGVADEESIDAVLQKSKAAFYAREQEQMLSYQEFLWLQFQFIRKKWWVLQLALLGGLWMFLEISGGKGGFSQEMGVIASLFVIFMIPELWKNRACQSMEIEGVSFYSLKQVYAARMALFAMVDICLLSLFCGIASVTLRLAVTELMVQFLLPMSVTACICFQVLCSRRHFNETIATVLCMGWSAVWAFIVGNKPVYTALTIPVWLVILAISVLYLCVVVHRAINRCNFYWEEKEEWN